jgi:integrase
MSPDDEVFDAELVTWEGPDLLPAQQAGPGPRYLVDQHTMLAPGELPPVEGQGPTYTEADFRISAETADLRANSKAANTNRMRETAWEPFEEWCQQQGRVARPCTTATFTEYGTLLMMTGKLRASSIKAYMSHIRQQQPDGLRPDNAPFLANIKGWTARNPRAQRKEQAYPLQLACVLAMVEACDEATPIGMRDATYLVYAYRFLARTSEPGEVLIEDLTITDDQIITRVVKDKTHQTEEQVHVMHNREDLRQVQRMRAWLAWLASQGITAGPVFRQIHKSGKLSGRAHATKRGDHLSGEALDARVKLAFKRAGLKSDGRKVTAHGLRAGGATDLALSGVRGRALNKAGRWSADSRQPEATYVRPIEDASVDVFAAVRLPEPPPSQPEEMEHLRPAAQSVRDARRSVLRRTGRR